MSEGDETADTLGTEAGGISHAPSANRFDQLSKWIALAANVGVVVSLVLVLIQLQQNERMMRAQTRHEMADGIVTLLLESAADEHLNDVLYRGNNGMPLSPADTYAYEMRTNALLRYWEDVHYQYRMGLYDEDEFDKQRLAWKASITRSARATTYWCRVRSLYSSEFTNEMDSLLAPGACNKAEQARESSNG